MKVLLPVLFVACTIFFSVGCFVKSLHVFYTADAVVEAPNLDGEWLLIKAFDKDQELEGAVAWTFAGQQITCYHDDIKSDMRVSYFKVGDSMFVDWTAGELADEKKPGTPNLFWLTHVVPCHSVFRVEHRGRELELIPLNVEWLWEACKDGRVKLPYVDVGPSLDDVDELPVFTATAEQWMAFLKKYGLDDEAFDDKNALLFRRPDPVRIQPEEQ